MLRSKPLLVAATLALAATAVPVTLPMSHRGTVFKASNQAKPINRAAARRLAKQRRKHR